MYTCSVGATAMWMHGWMVLHAHQPHGCICMGAFEHCDVSTLVVVRLELADARDVRSDVLDNTALYCVHDKL